MAIQWFDGFKNFNQAQILGRLGIAQDGSLTVDGNLVSNGSGGNIIVFNTLTDLQTAYPNGTNVPVWVISDSCWYYWTGTVTTDTTPPVDVTGLTIGTVTTTSIPIAWTKSTSSDVANYEVAYSSNGGSTWVVSNKVNSSSTSYTISGLTASTNYTVRVVAIDTSSNRSTGVTTTTTTSVPDTTPPLDVTNLVASAVTSTSLTLSWVASFALILVQVYLNWLVI